MISVKDLKAAAAAPKQQSSPSPISATVVVPERQTLRPELFKPVPKEKQPIPKRKQTPIVTKQPTEQVHDAVLQTSNAVEQLASELDNKNGILKKRVDSLLNWRAKWKEYLMLDLDQVKLNADVRIRKLTELLYKHSPSQITAQAAEKYAMMTADASFEAALTILGIAGEEASVSMKKFMQNVKDATIQEASFDDELTLQKHLTVLAGDFLRGWAPDAYEAADGEFRTRTKQQEDVSQQTTFDAGQMICDDCLLWDAFAGDSHQFNLYCMHKQSMYLQKGNFLPGNGDPRLIRISLEEQKEILRKQMNFPDDEIDALVKEHQEYATAQVEEKGKREPIAITETEVQMVMEEDTVLEELMTQYAETSSATPQQNQMVLTALMALQKHGPFWDSAWYGSSAPLSALASTCDFVLRNTKHYTEKVNEKLLEMMPHQISVRCLNQNSPYNTPLALEQAISERLRMCQQLAACPKSMAVLDGVVEFLSSSQKVPLEWCHVLNLLEEQFHKSAKSALLTSSKLWSSMILEKDEDDVLQRQTKSSPHHRPLRAISLYGRERVRQHVKDVANVCGPSKMPTQLESVLNALVMPDYDGAPQARRPIDDWRLMFFSSTLPAHAQSWVEPLMKERINDMLEKMEYTNKQLSDYKELMQVGGSDLVGRVLVMPLRAALCALQNTEMMNHVEHALRDGAFLDANWQSPAILNNTETGAQTLQYDVREYPDHEQQKELLNFAASICARQIHALELARAICQQVQNRTICSCEGTPRLCTMRIDMEKQAIYHSALSLVEEDEKDFDALLPHKREILHDPVVEEAITKSTKVEERCFWTHVSNDILKAMLTTTLNHCSNSNTACTLARFPSLLARSLLHCLHASAHRTGRPTAMTTAGPAFAFMADWKHQMPLMMDAGTPKESTIKNPLLERAYGKQELPMQLHAPLSGLLLSGAMSLLVDPAVVAECFAQPDRKRAYSHLPYGVYVKRKIPEEKPIPSGCKK